MTSQPVPLPPIVLPINMCNWCGARHKTSREIQACALIHFVAYIHPDPGTELEILGAALINFLGGPIEYQKLERALFENIKAVS